MQTLDHSLLSDAGRFVAELIREHVPNGRAHLVGLSIGGAVAPRLLLDTPEIIDHVMVSGTAARINPGLAVLMRVNEPCMRDLRPDAANTSECERCHRRCEFLF